MSISFSRSRGKNVVNASPFEVMSCGSLLLEQDSPELAKLYLPFIDYVPWEDKEDLRENIVYYLRHEKARTIIAHHGECKTRNEYSAKIFWTKVLT